MSKKIILILVGAIILILAGFIIYRGMMFSKELLKLEILGPEKAKMGEEIEYTVVYKNNGNFVLENPKLVFNLPENSLTEDDKLMFSQALDDIYPGAQNSIKFKARLLGKDGDLKTAKATLSYLPKNITATYESSTTFITKIDASPITLDFDLPTKAEQGKTLQFSINYFSNVDYPLENLSVKIDPVPGFEIKSSEPFSLDNQEWKLKTLNKAQGGRISITGKVSGDINHNLNFSASLGMWQSGRFIVIQQSTMEVQVIQPLLYVSQLVNGSSTYVATPGETLNYKVTFANIGSTPFENLFMVLRLSGSALDLSTLQVGNGGQVQANDNMIIWSSDQVASLRRLNVQQQGEVNFSVKVRSGWNPGSTDEAGTTITDEVNISQMTQKFTIKVSSGLAIAQKAFYKSDDISNSGPVPPQVGKATTYTINWEIKNYVSNVKNVKVKAILPKNVSLTGKIMPYNEMNNFSFDSVSREIVWSAGDILAGTGVNGDPVALSFQVSLTPDILQRGSKASLIGSAQISGENQFTNTAVSSQDNGVDTSLPDDFASSGGGVIQ